MNGTEFRLLNDWQHGFPRVAEPFARIGAVLGLQSEDVLAGYRALIADGRVSRIGAVFGAGAGGAGLLCAFAVPPRRLDAVAARVSAHPGVNHNYEREHRFNLWFVITGRDAAQLEAGVAALEADTGLAALRLPMQRAHRINLGFDLHGRTAAPAPRDAMLLPRRVPAVTEAERPLARLLEAGLPLVARPYDAWACALGRSREWVLDTLDRWLAAGTLRRFGVVVRHHELGFGANAMTVFDVPDAHAEARGDALAAQHGVTLAYRRARAPGWPYNVYCMVHGRDRGAVHQVLAAAIDRGGLAGYPRAVLFSRRRFTQRGASYFRDMTTTTGAQAVAG